MWLKLLWACLITGAVMATLQEVPRAPVAAWPLINHRFSLLEHPALQDEYDDSWRGKRTGPSLSVANPIEVLRNRLMLEIARRRLQKQDESQVLANREFLKSVGKRHTIQLRPASEEKSDSLDYYTNNGDMDSEWS